MLGVPQDASVSLRTLDMLFIFWNCLQFFLFPFPHSLMVYPLQVDSRERFLSGVSYNSIILPFDAQVTKKNKTLYKRCIEILSIDRKLNTCFHISSFWKPSKKQEMNFWRHKPMKTERTEDEIAGSKFCWVMAELPWDLTDFLPFGYAYELCTTCATLSPTAWKLRKHGWFVPRKCTKTHSIYFVYHYL